MDIVRLVLGIIVIVLGALILVDGILGLPMLEDVEEIFFEGVNPYFKLTLGFIILLLGGNLVEKVEKKN